MSGKPGMAAYVRARAGSPSNGPIASSNLHVDSNGQRRQAAAQAAKGLVSRTNMSLPSRTTHSGQAERRTPRSSGNLSPAPASSRGIGAADDPYSTDIEHFDDTVQSAIQVPDSQIDPQGLPYAHRAGLALHRNSRQYGELHGERGADEMLDEDASEDEEDDDDFVHADDYTQRQDDFTQAMQYGEGFDLAHARRVVSRSGETEQGRHTFPASVASYPTTTSGELETNESRFNVEELAVEEGGEEDEVGPLHSAIQRSSKQMQSQYRHSAPQTLQAPYDTSAQPVIRLTQHQASLRKRRSSEDLSASTNQKPFETEYSPAGRPTSSEHMHLRSAVLGPVHQDNLEHRQLPSPDASASVARGIHQNHRASSNGTHARSAMENLEYTPELLLVKPFQELMDEDHDYSPATNAAELSSIDPRDLATRLGEAQSLDAEGRKSFFSNLSLTEWEESGDWFLDRFGDLLQQIKASRRQRRQFATQYELEVAQRFAQIQSRKQRIEEALDEMRTQGNHVLHTPKRKRA